MKFLIINGPNINMLGIREPDIYGAQDFRALQRFIFDCCHEEGIEPVLFQSNHEGAIIDKIQEAYFDGTDGIVINPGAYTHYSYAIMDALKSVTMPKIEVHITDIDSREDFRKISYVRPVCVATVSGHGLAGYLEAMDVLVKGN